MPAFLASATRLGWATAGLAPRAPSKVVDAATNAVIRFMIDSSSLGKQLLEGRREGGRLIGPHPRSGKRSHAPDRGQTLRPGLEHHEAERLTAWGARAAQHPEGRG